MFSQYQKFLWFAYIIHLLLYLIGLESVNYCFHPVLAARKLMANLQLISRVTHLQYIILILSSVLCFLTFLFFCYKIYLILSCWIYFDKLPFASSGK